MEKEEILKEEANLVLTYNKIKSIIDSKDEYIANMEKEIVEFKQFVWEERSNFDGTETFYHKAYIDRTVKYGNDKIKQLFQLKKSLENAYFGRVDFKDDELTKVYIGLNNINDESRFYVFDWRAPISSLFYNHGVGSASYESPSGEIKGEILLKRQYKVNRDKLERCFDSDLNIDDDYLQEILSSSSSIYMKNIVNTIQKDQNAIIRNKLDKYLIVQGVAGSGKTSVALHRIAYLLYDMKDIQSKNILIFSPNEIFSQYISNVLPELGEENVMNTTFSDFSNSYLKGDLESFSTFIERYYNSDVLDYEAIKLKLSDGFRKFLDLYIKDFTKTIHFTKGLIVNKKPIDVNYLNDFLRNKYLKLPLMERLDLLVDDIALIAKISSSKTREQLKINLVSKLSRSLDIFNVYNSFLKFVSSISTKLSYSRGFIKYEDIVPMMYLYFEIYGYPITNEIKHVVIDEVQDYSLLQLELLKKIFDKASFTILGDSNQTINPYYKYDSLENLKEIFPVGRYLELNKTYRSSCEIIEYSNDILGLINTCSIRRENNIPVLIKEEVNIKLDLIRDIELMRKNGLKRIGIITKTLEETDFIYDVLKDSVDVTKINSNNDDVVVIPSYLSKGLEFDAVIAYNSKDNNYQEKDRYLFYVVCTRAQHQLIIYGGMK